MNRKQRIDIYVFKEGRISFEHKRNDVPVPFIYFPICDNKAVFLVSEEPSVSERRLKLVADYSGVAVYLETELLKIENRHFCSFLLNLIEDVFRHASYWRWQEGLMELSMRTEKVAKEHHVVERMHGFKKEQKSEKEEMKLRYVRVADL